MTAYALLSASWLQTGLGNDLSGDEASATAGVALIVALFCLLTAGPLVMRLPSRCGVLLGPAFVAFLVSAALWPRFSEPFLVSTVGAALAVAVWLLVAPRMQMEKQK